MNDFNYEDFENFMKHLSYVSFTSPGVQYVKSHATAEMEAQDKNEIHVDIDDDNCYNSVEELLDNLKRM